MPAITLEQFKIHARIDDCPDEDDLVQNYLDAGQRWTERKLEGKIYDTDTERDDAIEDGAEYAYSLETDPDLLVAVYMIGAGLYEVRHSTGVEFTPTMPASFIITAVKPLGV